MWCCVNGQEVPDILCLALPGLNSPRLGCFTLKRKMLRSLQKLGTTHPLTASHSRNTAETLSSRASFRATVNSTQLCVHSVDSACVNLFDSAINGCDCGVRWWNDYSIWIGKDTEGRNCSLNWGTVRRHEEHWSGTGWNPHCPKYEVGPWHLGVTVM